MKVKRKAAQSDPLLTPAEVAERCRVTERMVRRWMEERRFEFVELPKGRRVRESVLVEWLSENTIAPGA